MRNSIIIEEVYDILQKWKNHIGFIKKIRSSNIEKDVVDEWEERINILFRNKIKSKL